MAKLEKTSNNAISYLVSDISDSITSLEVTDAGNFPSDGNFRIIVDNEIMLVTAVSSNTFTIVRGSEGTTNLAHTSGAVVAHIVTTGGLEQYMRDHVPFFNDANKLPLNRCEDASGGTINAASFTASNQGSSTLADLDSGGMELFVPAAGLLSDDLRVWRKAALSTPYTVSACFYAALPRSTTGRTAEGSQVYLGFRDSVGGKIHACSWNQSVNNIAVTYWSSMTTFGSHTTVDTRDCGLGPVWFKIEDDGTNLKYYFSHNGITFQQLYSELRTATLDNAPDQIFLGGDDNQNINGFYASVLSWIEG